MVAGAFAGVSEHCVMFPMDTVKTRMQVAGAVETSLLETARSARSRSLACQLAAGSADVQLAAEASCEMAEPEQCFVE